MYLAYVFFSNSAALGYQFLHARSFGQISGVPQTLYANLGFVGLSKISARHLEIYYSIFYLSFYPIHPRSLKGPFFFLQHYGPFSLALASLKGPLN
jgi:hypothetical protein